VGGVEGERWYGEERLAITRILKTAWAPNQRGQKPLQDTPPVPCTPP